MSKEIPFDPIPFLKDPHQQTIISSLFNFLFEPASERKILSLVDGDKISLEITTPLSWKAADATVLLVHGLCGSHKSPNLVRMAKRLESVGIRAIRFNMRGCGSGKGLARAIYHGGRSEDIFEAIKSIKKDHPESPLILVGFSLGGNIVLKLGGELGALASPFLTKIIAVSPPVDIYSSVKMIGTPANAVYEAYFYRLLRSEVLYRHRKFKDLPPVSLPRDLKMYEFDQLYLAPRCGFRSAEDYYDKCSACHFVSDIAIPCKILFAEDDPIISPASLDAYQLPSNIDLFKTKKGGHMGYLASPISKNGFYWLDSLLIEWITEP